MNIVKNVAIVGAGGRIGDEMAKALLSTGKYIITVLARNDSTSNFPAGINVQKADYGSHPSPASALKGQVALVITLSRSTPEDVQSKPISAAAEASVPWILPNEWESDQTHPKINTIPMDVVTKGTTNYPLGLPKEDLFEVTKDGIEDTKQD